MSKFKIGDRVIVGVRDGAVVSMEHADARSTKLVTAAHDAIDRLVTELERQATEHVHALDALRAENEALRTQNEHLRHLVEESRKVHEMNAREVGQAAALVGKWPGIETDEQVEAAMRVLDGVLPTR